MSKAYFSIKRSLLVWLLSSLFLLSAAFALVTYGLDRITLRDQESSRLRQIAVGLPADLQHADLSHINVELRHRRDDFILQIWDSEHRLIYHSHPDLILPQFTQTGFSIQPWGGDRWKAFIRYADGNLIQIAQSISARKEIAKDEALHRVVPLLLFIPVIAFFIPFCVNRGLRSLSRLSRELDRRNSSSLAPLQEAQQPAEIVPLTRALNTLLTRLGGALEQQRNFIADASHELRTPLTTLQIQAQLVEHALGPAQRHAALDDLKTSIRRTGHLVEQLLMVSKLEAEGEQAAFRPVDLAAAAREVVLALLPFAQARKIDLGMAGSGAGAAPGDADQLKLLARNLIDNAIRYTPAGGQVDVEIIAGDGYIDFCVEDSGPGIPADQHARVFDRFFRCVGHDLPGSGLGLSIVRQVAQRHHGSIRLGRSERLGGLSVRVRFGLAWRQHVRNGGADAVDVGGSHAAV
ncbi:ATP-binding protein [Duganella levis]|uniref:histidine kinase n=1 Tax=Duganella levis TaxID=2692169 RepID=A0ABW9W3X3_9BURK|nr:ATP-binding protein [Duganella levis]MYN28721.1 two-component sensor histidine kinase [Duganella levis]